jgi:hypothetical protein
MHVEFCADRVLREVRERGDPRDGSSAGRVSIAAAQYSTPVLGVSQIHDYDICGVTDVPR